MEKTKKGHNMTEMEKLQEEIFDKIRQVRPKSLKLLLILYKQGLEWHSRESFEYWKADAEKDRLKFLTKKIEKVLSELQSFEYQGIKFTYKPSKRKARDYKYALEALVLIKDYHDKSYQKMMDLFMKAKIEKEIKKEE